MKNPLIALSLILLCSATALAQSAKYKCLLQMDAYKGEAAYVVISVINPKGAYEKTLAVLGPDKQWYNTLKEWHKFQTKTRSQLSTLTGASVNGGDRAVRNIEIDENYFNKGYKLRFESAVEEQKYVVNDVELPISSEAITQKTEGKGYLKFVKLNKVQ